MHRPRSAALATITATLILGGLAGSASAHPGHDADLTGIVAGLVHPLSGIDHLIAMVMIGVLAVRLGRRGDLLRIPAAFIGSMMLGIAAGAAGLVVPGAEPMVSTTVILLGLVVAVAPRPSAARALPMVVFAGLLHGYAHGTELPAQAATYVAGVIGSSILLHAIGVGGGLLLSSGRRAAGLRYGAAAITAGFALAWSLGLTC